MGLFPRCAPLKPVALRRLALQPPHHFADLALSHDKTFIFQPPEDLRRPAQSSRLRRAREHRHC